MKPRIPYIVLTLSIIIAGSVFAVQQHQLSEWDTFGRNLTKALDDDNDGIKRSALQQIIRFHDSLDVKDAAITILHIYRSHPDFQTRRLALTALSKTNSNFALGYLRLAYDYEKSPVLKKQILFILKKAEGDVNTTTLTRSAQDTDFAALDSTGTVSQ
jgi:hypothetical protein